MGAAVRSERCVKAYLCYPAVAGLHSSRSVGAPELQAERDVESASEETTPRDVERGGGIVRGHAAAMEKEEVVVVMGEHVAVGAT